MEQLRSAIYALNHSSDEGRTSLPEMLEQLSVVHMPDELAVSLRVGGTPAELPGGTEHALLRIAGEALFNAAVHAHATRAVLRLTYRAETVILSISDDGDGDPARMRLILKLAASNDLDGRHRGLANMQSRARELGGTLDVRRARIGECKCWFGYLLLPGLTALPRLTAKIRVPQPRSRNDDYSTPRLRRPRRAQRPCQANREPCCPHRACRRSRDTAARTAVGARARERFAHRR